MSCKLLIMLCSFILLTGCSVEKQEAEIPEQAESTHPITYAENDKILKYDELLLWASDMASEMSRENYETSETDETGLINRDYGYAKIIYSKETAPEIIRLEMVRPNLACPRGVFIGNPVEKIAAYYHSSEDEYGKGLNYYFEDIKDKTEKYSYCIRYDDRIEMAAASNNGNGTFTYLKLEYELKDEKVESIIYTSDFEKPEEETRNTLLLEKEEVTQRTDEERKSYRRFYQ